MSNKPLIRIIQIDFLRGIAILLVILEHGAIQPEQSGRFHRAALFFHNFGWTGVDLFFVLSGFLIGGLLFTELRLRGELNVKRFIIRRGFKIWPLYYLYLAAATVSLAVTEHLSLFKAVRHLAPQYLHLQNFFLPDFSLRLPLAHTWSLAIEEHFYLFLPFLLVFLTRKQHKPGHPITGVQSIPAVPLVGIIIMLACLCLRLRLWHHPYASNVQFTPTQLRMDSLFAGVLLAYFWHYHRAQLRPALARPGLLIASGLVLISPMFTRFLTQRAVWTFGFTLLYLGYGCILLGVMATTLPEGNKRLLAAFFRTRMARAIAFIGFYSYPIYLFHIAAIVLAYPLCASIHPPALRWLLNSLLNVAGGTLIGVILGRLVEIPALALRDRLFANEASRALNTASNT